MRSYITDLWDAITRLPIDISECTTFKQARRWFARHDVPAAKAARTQEELETILLNEVEYSPVDVPGETRIRDIRIYLDGLSRDANKRPTTRSEWQQRADGAETMDEFIDAHKALKSDG